MGWMMQRVLTIIVVAFTLASGALAQTQKPALAQKPATTSVEYYYTIKWGLQDEFLRLFKKNHWPVLQEQIETGRIVSATMVAPEFHMTEDARWDYRVTIVFNKDAMARPFDEDALKKKLFPDQATFTREEQRRFEILLAHWDLPLKDVPLEQAPKP